MPARIRLDVALLDRGLVDTRAKAQGLIMARRVTMNGQVADKPGLRVADDDQLQVVALEHPWVGRGGMKLAHALAHFGIDVKGKTCVDLGASTGGFTHVLLVGGATKVYAIDVGHGQIDQSLRVDPRVVNREKVNARFLDPTDFEEAIQFLSADLSFISLRLVLPAIARIVSSGVGVVALIKPQFEVGKRDVGKGGIIRDEGKRQEAVDAVVATAIGLGFELTGITESPIRGAEGNVEYLMALRKL
ncbi:MAG TPA: TlyA family RNA methyltransferase [Thermoanaerobaculia bacterium]|nr:TlyA family RNA methyltransferase [Thermoanaerobaculia bacterium]